MKSRKWEWILIGASTLLILVVLGFTGGLNIASFKQNYTGSLVSSYAVSGGETVRKIEYAVKYGKPLSNFYGIEELLRTTLSHTPDLREILVVQPDGIVLYNQAGRAEGRKLDHTLVEKFAGAAEGKGSEDYSFAQSNDLDYVFLPIHDKSEQVIGQLAMVFEDRVVQSQINRYMPDLLRSLFGLALAAMLGLMVYFSRARLFTEQGGIRKARVMAAILIVLSTAQIIFGVLNYQLFKNAYVETAQRTAAQTAATIQKDIRAVIDKGVTYDKLYGLDDYLQRIVQTVPVLHSIAVHDAQGATIATTPAEEGAVAPDGNAAAYVNELPKDGTGLTAQIHARLSQEYVQSRLWEIILDTLTVLVTSFLFMVEMTLFVLIVLERKLNQSWGIGAGHEETSAGELDKDTRMIRPLAFVLFMAMFMSTSFIPMVMKQLYEPFFGLSKTVAMGLPISADMLFAGAATIAAGYMIDKQGWRRVFYLGLICFGSGTLLSALASGPVMFIGARALAGAGYGFALMSMRGCVNLASTDKIRSTGVSALFSGLYAGLNCGVVVGAMLADRIGYKQVFFVAFAIVVLALLLALFFLRSSPAEAASRKEALAKRRLSMLTSPGVKLQDREKTAEAERKTGVLSAFLFNGKVIGFFVLLLIPMAVCSMFLDYYFPVFAESSGISSSNIGRAFLVNGLCIVYLGPLLTKWVSRHISPGLSMIAAGLIVVAAMMWFAVSESVTAAFAAVILLGVADSFGLTAQNNYFVRLEATGRIGTGKALGYYGNIKKIGQMLGPMVFGSVAALGGFGVGLIGVGLLVSLLLFAISSGMFNIRRSKKEQAMKM
ncbi:MFS transporter [Paenibacillus sp. y28]|uniref:MFS transporter n=1 Tax=Paenibacillus sp. y28 TaxID=3129110 RepID=UPI00301888D5